ncbi:TPA: hypothetical protein ACGOSI_002183 [Streptococcus suis]
MAKPNPQRLLGAFFVFVKIAVLTTMVARFDFYLLKMGEMIRLLFKIAVFGE